MMKLDSVTTSLKRLKVAKQGAPASRTSGTLGVCSAALAACMVLTNMGASFSASAEASLAEQSQNPISSLISLPFEFDSNQNVGLDEKTQNVLLIKPVVPVPISPNWNLVLRGIFPIIDQPSSGPTKSDTGLGDIQLQTFFVPKATIPIAKDGFLTWGIGPIFQFDTASSKVLGTGRTSVGINGVVFAGIKPWTFGALVSNIWSVGSDSTREDGTTDAVNLLTVQPILNYNLANGWYLKSAPIITHNWDGESGDRWTIPIGGGFGRVFKMGKQHVNASLTGYGYLDRPDYATDLQIQAQVTFLFPK